MIGLSIPASCLRLRLVKTRAWFPTASLEGWARGHSPAVDGGCDVAVGAAGEVAVGSGWAGAAGVSVAVRVAAVGEGSAGVVAVAASAAVGSSVAVADGTAVGETVALACKVAVGAAAGDVKEGCAAGAVAGGASVSVGETDVCVGDTAPICVASPALAVGVAAGF